MISREQIDTFAATVDPEDDLSAPAAHVHEAHGDAGTCNDAMFAKRMA